jgi:branched-chain amino acid transport system substrate-binding protein
MAGQYGAAPNVFAALGYDAAKMLVDAIGRAKSSDPTQEATFST